jgi:biopolymer transport protein ExbB
MVDIDAFRMLMERGGPLMWPLLGLSVVVGAITLERAIFWLRLHGRGGRAAFTALLQSLRAGTAVKGRRSPYRTLAEAFQAEGAALDEATGVAECEEARGLFDRGLVVLSTIVTAAPMLGILGTVLGIIESFELLGGDGSISDPTQVSGGIAEALITTAAGLVVALCALFPSMVFRAQQDRAVGRMESLLAAALRGRTGWR